MYGDLKVTSVFRNSSLRITFISINKWTKTFGMDEPFKTSCTTLLCAFTTKKFSLLHFISYISLVPNMPKDPL